MSLNTILATAPLTTTNYVIKATGTALGNSIIYDNGTNVGIGNTNTTYKLDVTGTGNFSDVLRVSAATGFAVGSIAGYRRMEYVSTTFSLLTDADGYAGLNAGAGTFSTSLVVGATDSTWNLASSTKLQIQNSILAGYSTTGTFLGMNLTYNSAAWKYISTGYASLYSQDSGDHLFFTSSSGTAAATATINEKVRITNAGNVGIGTNSPTAKLSVIDNLSTYGVIRIQNNSTSGYSAIEVFDSSSSQVGAMGYANASAASTAGNMLAGGTTERMRISAAGLVTVIGTGSASTAEGIYFKRTSALDQGGFISGSGGVLNLYATNAYSSLYGTMVFGRYNGTTTEESMRITSDGYVGIGTTNPPFKLTVAQDITNDPGDIAVGQFAVTVATTTNKSIVI